MPYSAEDIKKFEDVTGKKLADLSQEELDSIGITKTSVSGGFQYDDSDTWYETDGSLDAEKLAQAQTLFAAQGNNKFSRGQGVFVKSKKRSGIVQKIAQSADNKFMYTVVFTDYSRCVAQESDLEASSTGKAKIPLLELITNTASYAAISYCTKGPRPMSMDTFVFALESFLATYALRDILRFVEFIKVQPEMSGTGAPLLSMQDVQAATISTVKMLIIDTVYRVVMKKSHTGFLKRLLRYLSAMYVSNVGVRRFYSETNARYLPLEFSGR